LLRWPQNVEYATSFQRIILTEMLSRAISKGATENAGVENEGAESIGLSGKAGVGSMDSH